MLLSDAFEALHIIAWQAHYVKTRHITCENVLVKKYRKVPV
jgi:hypothetical protein